MGRIRIVFLIDKAVDSGGAERFALGLATHLPRDRFDAWLVSTRVAEPGALAILREAGVRHLNLGRSAKWDVHRFRALIALLKRERFDILHSHMFGSNVWGTVLGRACGVPVILAHEHNWSYSGNRLRMLIDRNLIGRFATRFVAVSHANQERMVTLEHVPESKIVVLPTAYIPRAGSANGDIRSELGLAPHSPLIGVAAVLRVEKALEVMIEAHARVLQRVPDAELLIAGEGPCRPMLERRAAELNIAERVHFPGFRTDTDSILRAVDIGAMSSDWEGMPLFVFECMAAGTPLVATSVGGLPEIVDHRRTGVLVPPRDPDALADALVELLRDPDLRRRIAAAASERAPEFTIDAVASRFATLYEALLEEARSSPSTSRA